MEKVTGKILGAAFFNRPTLIVAEELLGKFLVVEKNGVENGFMISEVEAYHGFKDRASHAFRGRTKRNNVMFGEAGFWYVYFIYGMYNMLNIVTDLKNYPAAILIRSAGEYSGPGKLTKALGIDRTFNEKFAGKEQGLWIEDRGVEVEGKVKKTPRIGVAYAGKTWANKPYRFVLRKSGTG